MFVTIGRTDVETVAAFESAVTALGNIVQAGCGGLVFRSRLSELFRSRLSESN